jgi:hypothetical protein
MVELSVAGRGTAGQADAGLLYRSPGDTFMTAVRITLPFASRSSVVPPVLETRTLATHFPPVAQPGPSGDPNRS